MSDVQPIDLDDLQRVAVKVRELTDDNWLADMVELAHDEIDRLRGALNVVGECLAEMRSRLEKHLQPLPPGPEGPEVEP